MCVLYTYLQLVSFMHQTSILSILGGRHSIVGNQINAVTLLFPNTQSECFVSISYFSPTLSAWFWRCLCSPKSPPLSLSRRRRKLPTRSYLPPPSLTLVSIIQPVVYIWCLLSYYSSMSNLWSVSKLCLYFSELDRKWVFIIIFISLQHR